MWRFLLGTADPERRAALNVLVVMRWVLVAAALFQVNYRPGSEPEAFALLNSLILLAAALNGILQWRLLRPRPIPHWFPLVVGFYDVVAVTSAIGTVEGFDNPSFLLYYPALLSFVLVFPGKWSFVYTFVVMAAYTLSIGLSPSTFDETAASDQKALVMRLLTLATAGLMANLVVRLERSRRLAAVDAEGRAAVERLAAEQRALEAERHIDEERRRLSQEIHDGVSQRIYLLSLGLDNSRVAAQRSGDEGLATQLQTLHEVSREALLETRNLLFDLGRVMAGTTPLDDLARNLAREFSAVTGISVSVVAGEDIPPLGAAEVGELFRIMQEAMANVMKHSGAKQVVISIVREGTNLLVTVDDDGRGIEHGENRGGHGLANIGERALRIGGTSLIATRAEGGTRLALSIPIPEPAQ